MLPLLTFEKISLGTLRPFAGKRTTSPSFTPLKPTTGLELGAFTQFLLKIQFNNVSWELPNAHIVVLFYPGVIHVRRDAGHFRQDAPHATQVDDDALQEASASGGQRAREK
jgi:hypothetical protein